MGEGGIAMQFPERCLVSLWQKNQKVFMKSRSGAIYISLSSTGNFMIILYKSLEALLTPLKVYG